jgi:hypothetical protein
MAERRSDDEHYSRDEAQQRFDDALRGAFKTPPTPMKDIPKKRRLKNRIRAHKKQKPR